MLLVGPLVLSNAAHYSEGFAGRSTCSATCFLLGFRGIMFILSRGSDVAGFKTKTWAKRQHESLPRHLSVSQHVIIFHSYALNDATGRGPSIWDTFSHVPGNIAQDATADVACDHFHRFKDYSVMLHPSRGVCLELGVFRAPELLNKLFSSYECIYRCTDIYIYIHT